MFRHRGSVSPIPQSGLSLWLKADAGVTTVAEQFISQVVISGGGRSAMNGTYTRGDGGIGTPFIKTGDANFQIYWIPEDNIWVIEGTAFYCDALDTNIGYYAYNPSYDMSANWVISEPYGCDGTPPTGSITLSPTGNILVTAWADQSGNGRNANSYGENPIYNSSNLNGKPTISLTSMSDYVTRAFTISSNPLGASGSTAFSVQYVEDVCNNSDSNGPIFGNFGSPIDDEVQTQSHYPYGVDCTVYDAFATTTRKSSLTPPETITNVWTLYSVHSTDGEWKDYVNGQLMHSDPTNTYNSIIGGDDSTLYIGRQTANGDHTLKGKVAEAIVYNRVLTTQERQQVEAYLNTKYAIY
jgi:hypothetical protein